MNINHSASAFTALDILAYSDLQIKIEKSLSIPKRLISF